MNLIKVTLDGGCWLCAAALAAGMLVCIGVRVVGGVPVVALSHMPRVTGTFACSKNVAGFSILFVHVRTALALTDLQVVQNVF
jgi:hypothetical protein